VLLGPLIAVIAAAAPGDTGLSERDVVRIHVRSPYKGQSAPVTSRSLIDVLERGLRQKTILAARAIDDTAQVAEVGGDIIALMKLARPAGETGRYLLVVSMLPANGKTRISAIVVDMDKGFELLAREERAPDAEARAEQDARFQEVAVVARAPAAEVMSDDEAAIYAEQLIDETLRPVLEQSRAWGPMGAIAVSGTREDVEIRLDGAAVGIARSGMPVRLFDVRPGDRTLSVAAAGQPPVERAVHVAGGETIELDFSGVALASRHERFRAIALWSAVGVAAAGAGIVISGAIAAGNAEPNDSCFTSEGQPGMTCPPTWLHTGSNGAGVAIVPLGLGLALGGALTALGIVTVEDDDEIPWVSMMVGTGLVFAAYGVAVAAEGGNPP